MFGFDASDTAHRYGTKYVSVALWTDSTGVSLHIQMKIHTEKGCEDTLCTNVCCIVQWSTLDEFAEAF
jgi:hypothetical protein